MFKKILILAVSFLMLASCSLFGNRETFSPTLVQVSEELLLKESDTIFFVSIKINPEIDLVVDENGIVVSFVNKNEDAEILTSNLDLIGMDVNAAVELIVSEAVLAGYINEDGEVSSDVLITVVGATPEQEQDLEQELEDSVNEFIERNAINAIARSRKVVDKDYLAKAAEAGLTVEEYTLSVLSDKVGYEYNPDLNYGQNVSNLVRQLNDVAQSARKEEVAARVEENKSRKDEKVEEAKERAASKKPAR